MDKRFWICGIVVSVAALLLDFLVHGVLLQPDYAALVPTGIYRAPADANAYMPYMFAAHILIGFGLTWLYRKGMEPGRAILGQGLRFGAAVSLMSTIPGYLIYYAVQPLPAAPSDRICSTASMFFLFESLRYVSALMTFPCWSNT